MDQVQRKGDFKVSGMRGRVKRGVQRQPLPQILFPEETALAAGFLLGFLVDWVTVRDCFVPSSPKAVNGLVRGFQKSKRGAKRETRSGRGVGERSESNGNDDSCQETLPDSAPRAASAKCKHIP